jgi:dsRNA-specific ribonuclease
MRESLKFNHKEFQEKLEILLDFLEIPYKNILHYIQAFVHRSILNEKISDFKQNNERLEFF